MSAKTPNPRKNKGSLKTFISELNRLIKKHKYNLTAELVVNKTGIKPQLIVSPLGKK